MKEPEVSICITTYNGEEFIKETIESALNQSYKFLEILVVDDDSTDNTINIIEQINDSRIRIIRNKKRKGMVKNWNTAYMNAKGKYVMFLCQDDVLNKECLTKKVKAIKQDKNIVLAFSATSVIDKEDKIRLTRRLYRKDKVVEGKALIKKSFRIRNMYGEPSNILFKKEICKKAGYFNEDLIYTPDWAYWLNISRFGKVAYVKDDLTWFRISDTSTTRNLLKNKGRMDEDERKFVDYVKKEFKGYINWFDIMVHKIVNKIRLYLKLIFVQFL